MNPLALINGRRSRPRRHEPLAQIAIGPALTGAFAYPGYDEPDDGARTRTFLTGSALLHGALFGVLVLLASLAPVIEEHVIPVQLLREELPPHIPPPEEPASAPKALAMRRNLPFAPAVQAVAPQIVNPKIIAEAKPVVTAKAIQMDALGVMRGQDQTAGGAQSQSSTVIDQRALSNPGLIVTWYTPGADLNVRVCVSPSLRSNETALPGPNTCALGPLQNRTKSHVPS